MTINEQAIEAATEALILAVKDDQTISWASDLPDWCSTDLIQNTMQFCGVEGSIDIGHIAETVIEAALPALEQQIREQVAEEIRAYLDGFNSHGLPYRDGIYAGINSAAQIAQGKQA